jgi:hypothetical protein
LFHKTSQQTAIFRNIISGRLFQLIPNDNYVPIIYEIAKYRFSLWLAEIYLSYL